MLRSVPAVDHGKVVAGYGIIWKHRVTHARNNGVTAMEIPIIEIDNYTLFHEMAATTLDSAARLSTNGSVAIAHHDSEQVTILRVTGPAGGPEVEGELDLSHADLLQVLLGLPASGSMAQTSLGTVVAAPVMLAAGGRFGSLFLIAPNSSNIDYTTLHSMRSLARLLGYAIDSERLVSHDRLTGLYNRALFDDHLALEIARSRRNGVCLCVLVSGCEFPDIDGV